MLVNQQQQKNGSGSGINITNASNLAQNGNQSAAGLSQLYDQMTPEAPQIDPRYQGLQKKQQQQATNFQKQLPVYTGDLISSAAQTGRQQLAAAQEGVKEGAQNQGLLYSGMEQGGEGAAGNTFANNLASTTSNINQAGQSAADAMNLAPIATGMGLAGVNTGEANYNLASEGINQASAITNMLNNNAGYGALGQGVGQLAGTAVGGLINPSTAPTYNGAGNNLVGGYMQPFNYQSSDPYSLTGGGQ